MFWIKEMGKYAGSMRTRALSGAETIHVNGEVLEYLIQGNQHGYCVVHTPQCRTYGTMPYAVWNMPYGSTHPLYCVTFVLRRAWLSTFSRDAMRIMCLSLAGRWWRPKWETGLLDRSCIIDWPGSLCLCQVVDTHWLHPDGHILSEI